MKLIQYSRGNSQMDIRVIERKERLQTHLKEPRGKKQIKLKLEEWKILKLGKG